MLGSRHKDDIFWKWLAVKFIAPSLGWQKFWSIVNFCPVFGCPCPDWTKFKYYAAYKNYKRGWALPGMQERRVMDLSLWERIESFLSKYWETKLVDL